MCFHSFLFYQINIIFLKNAKVRAKVLAWHNVIHERDENITKPMEKFFDNSYIFQETLKSRLDEIHKPLLPRMMRSFYRTGKIVLSAKKAYRQNSSDLCFQELIILHH